MLMAIYIVCIIGIYYAGYKFGLYLIGSVHGAGGGR